MILAPGCGTGAHRRFAGAIAISRASAPNGKCTSTDEDNAISVESNVDTASGATGLRPAHSGLTRSPRFDEAHRSEKQTDRLALVCASRACTTIAYLIATVLNQQLRTTTGDSHVHKGGGGGSPLRQSPLPPSAQVSREPTGAAVATADAVLSVYLAGVKARGPARLPWITRGGSDSQVWPDHLLHHGRGLSAELEHQQLGVGAVLSDRLGDVALL